MRCRPCARNWPNQSRSSAEVRRASPPPTISRSPSNVPSTSVPRRNANVRQRKLTPSRSSAASEVTTLVVDAIA